MHLSPHVLGRAALLAGAVLLMPVMSAGTEPAEPATKPPETRQVATAEAGDFRVTYTAHRLAGDGGMNAGVYVTAYERRAGTWTPISGADLPGTSFWFVVTTPGGVCDLSVSEYPRAEASITLSLGSSLGCGKPVTFHVEDGMLVRE